MDPTTQNQRLWNEWSDDFQALWNRDTDSGELPPAPCPFDDEAPGGSHPELLPTVDGRTFVELGCGGGQASVGTAQAGANRVVGVDFSSEQLAHARELQDAYGVEAEFLEGDVSTLPLADDAFDVAFSGWVYQMVEDIDAALAEAHRVLRDGGVFVFDVPHPVYERFDATTGTLERSYHDDEPREVVIKEAYDSTMVVYDRSVSGLHNALVEAGFTVKRLLEPGSDDPEDYDEDDPFESNQPEMQARLPRNLRFWAVA